MGTKQYKGPKPGPQVDGSETINGWVRKIAESQTYPAVRRRNALSLDADPVELYFYQKLQRGRRCTCWGKDTSPSSGCHTCFGAGIVGGYQKYGTAQVMIDPSLPEVETTGLVVATSEDGPEAWTLDDNTLTGSLQCRIHFQGNWGPVDHLSQLQWLPDGGVVRWTVRPLGYEGFVPLNNVNLNSIMERPQIMEVRMEMERPGLEAQSPVVINAMLRVKRTPTSEMIVRADRPKITKAWALAELGVLDEWTTALHWLDHTLPHITSEDWFYNIDEHKRWKVVDATALSPQGYLISWDATCRYVQDFEPIAAYPV